MKADAVAHLRNVRLRPGIVAYIECIDPTLEPYGGRFLIHGGPIDALEGTFDGDLIVIEFPNRENAGSLRVAQNSSLTLGYGVYTVLIMSSDAGFRPSRS
jgi:uncharacterized protein (DUF1330 family)